MQQTDINFQMNVSCETVIDIWFLTTATLPNTNSYERHGRSTQNTPFQRFKSNSVHHLVSCGKQLEVSTPSTHTIGSEKRTSGSGLHLCHE